MVVRKYSNRRMYDTDESRYVKLDDLAKRMRDGVDVQVVDASTGDDITHHLLAQVLAESRGALRLVPPDVLRHLIQMHERDLTDFLSKRLPSALHDYIAIAEAGPAVIAAAPELAAVPQQVSPQQASPPPPSPSDWEDAPAEAGSGVRPKSSGDDVADLRREVAELRELMLATTKRSAG